MASPHSDYAKEDGRGSPLPSSDRDFRGSPPPPPPGRSRSPVSSRGSRSPHRERSPSTHSRSRSPRREAPAGTTLYVACLSAVTTESELERRFAKYGKVLDCKLVTDPRTRESRGFGFVAMESAEAADDAIDHLHNTDVDGRKITIEKARRSRARSPTPGKYLGSDRVRRGITSRAPPPPTYGYGNYGRSGGGRYTPYPPPPYSGYGYGYPIYASASYGRPSYTPHTTPAGRYADRYSPYRRVERERSPIRRVERDRYPTPPFRGGGGGGQRDTRDHSPFYARERSPRSRSRSRERAYL